MQSMKTAFLSSPNHTPLRPRAHRRAGSLKVSRGNSRHSGSATCISTRPSCRTSFRETHFPFENLEWCFQCNQQYSITAMTDQSGGILERYVYTAYGTPTFLNASGTPHSTQVSQLQNRYTYTGREWDGVLTLYHYRARLYGPVAGRFCSRDPKHTRKTTVYYLFVLSSPTRFLDSSGTTPEEPSLPPSIDNCTNEERDLIQRAKEQAKARLARNKECFSGMRNASESCRSELHDCISQALERSSFSCGYIGQGDCHTDRPAPEGVTATPCAKLKSDASDGKNYPEPDRKGDPKSCEPCKHPEEAANNCKLCPEGGGYGMLRTWICRSGPGQTIVSEIESLTELLVHEAAHNCVGSHLTTKDVVPGGKQDKCQRPDAKDIADSFENCR